MVETHEYFYEGHLRDGQPHGRGLQRFKGPDGNYTGLEYTGDFEDGLADTDCRNGVAHWSSGFQFVGCFKRGCPTIGEFKSNDGNTSPARFCFKGEEGGHLLQDITDRDILKAKSQDGSRPTESQGAGQTPALLKAETSLEANSLGGSVCCSGRDERMSANHSEPNLNSNHEIVHLLISNQKASNDKPSQPVRSPAKNDFLTVLSKMFPDCEASVLNTVLQTCGEDVKDAIDFLLPVDIWDTSIHSHEVHLQDKIGNAICSSVERAMLNDWNAGVGSLTLRIKVQNLAREFEALGNDRIKEALEMYAMDETHARQYLQSVLDSLDDVQFRHEAAPATRTFPKANSRSGKAASRGPADDYRAAPRSTLPTSQRAQVFSRASMDQHSRKLVDHWFDSSAGSHSEDQRPKSTGNPIIEKCWQMDGEVVRKEASKHYQLYKQGLASVFAAHEAGDVEVAERNRMEANVHKDLYDQMIQIVNQKVVRDKNCDDARFVDLHLLHKEPALELLKTRLTRWARMSKGRKFIVEVITGAGNHSRNGRPVLRPAVKEWLLTNGVNHWEVDRNHGVLKVDASTFLCS